MMNGRAGAVMSRQDPGKRGGKRMQWGVEWDG